MDLCIRKVSEALELGKPADSRPPFHGRGMACAVKAPAMPNDAASTVVLKFCEDSTCEVLVSGTDIGQGLRTVAAQFAAEALCLPIENVRVRNQPDTDLSPYDWQTVASRQTWATGNAIFLAAEKIKAQMFDMVSQVLAVPADELQLEPGRVTARDGRSVVLERLVMGYQFEDGHTIGGPLAAAAAFVPEGLLFLDPETSQSAKPVAKWTFGAQGVELNVDPETGRIGVERVVACYDVGRVIHPGMIRGQTYGGIVQGLGTGMLEELLLDRQTGRIANASLMDYKIPTSLDVPAVMEAHFVETAQLDGPMGARGIGEQTMIPTPAAIANALYDACGIRIDSMSITAEKVLAAIRAKQAEDAAGGRSD